ncbi:MAG: hypothetical protein ACREI7_08520, partial [Myxococcota bacterium]
MRVVERQRLLAGIERLIELVLLQIETPQVERCVDLRRAPLRTCLAIRLARVGRRRELRDAHNVVEVLPRRTRAALDSGAGGWTAAD